MDKLIASVSGIAFGMNRISNSIGLARCCGDNVAAVRVVGVVVVHGQIDFNVFEASETQACAKARRCRPDRDTSIV